LFAIAIENQKELYELYQPEKRLKMNQDTIRGNNMKEEYDLSKMKSRKNPYAKHLKKQVTMRLGVDVIEYFKSMAQATGVPYQNLINLYLKDCAVSHRELKMQWR